MTEKKEILDNAADKVQSKNARIKNWLAKVAKKTRDVARRANWMIVFNIALLAVIVVLLFVLYGRVKNAHKPVKPAAMRARPTLVISRNFQPMKLAISARPLPANRKIIREKNASAKKNIAREARKATFIETRPTQAVPTLPLRQAVPVKPTKRVSGNVIIDGQNRVVGLQNIAVVDGNLFLQNMRRYTLPCGIKINGDLFLRDVKLLKFCGDFSVSGNIYVSRDSAFGPIPKNAKLGGQVIF